MSEGQVYNIPAARFSWFKERMDKMAKKALKVTGKRSFFTAVGFHNEDDKKSHWFGQKIMEVFVAVPEPKYEGWTFAARIDHANEAGNIIRASGLIDVPESYRETDPTCDHCNHKRKRRDTYLVYHEEHGYKQVGSSCLADFLGHKDVGHIAKLAELLSTINAYARGSRENTDLQDRRTISLEQFMECSAQAILDNGWVSKSDAFNSYKTATSDVAWQNMNGRHPICDRAKELAGLALEWALSLDESGQELNDYLYNCWVIANNPLIEARSTGLAASIVGVFLTKHYDNGRAPRLNEFFGLVGDKVTLELLPLAIEPRDRYYIHRAQDRNGREFVWFNKTKMFHGIADPVMKFKGTISKHAVFASRLSTTISYVKVVD